MGSRVIDWNTLTAVPTKVGERRDVFNAPTATLDNFECHITTLNPGEIPHPAHHHPDEELIVLKEGTLNVTISGRTQRVGPGAVIFFASNEVHGMKNVGTTRATYYVFRFVTPLTPPAGDSFLDARLLSLDSEVRIGRAHPEGTVIAFPPEQ